MVKLLWALLALQIFVSACNNRDVANVAADEEERIFRFYQVTGEEGRDEVTVRLQFLAGGPEGDAVALQPPGGVTLDNVALPVDSTRFTGTYYEISKPAQAFAGSHTIVFTDEAKKQHREEFRFLPFTLAEELPEELPKKAFTVRLGNLPQEPVTLRLVMTDTSMTSAGVNETLTVENGELVVSDDLLTNLSPGPVTMEIYSEEERPLGKRGARHGRIAITYGLRRQLVLR